MIIRTEGGRHRSLITDEEKIRNLAQRWDSMSEEEKTSVQAILDELDFLSSEGSIGFDELAELIGYSPTYHGFAEAHYDDRLVGVEEFMLDDYYFGTSGKGLFPKWLADLNELFAGNYTEAIITGSLGGGKTTFCGMAQGYMFYELCMLKDPQATYGLMPGSEIVLVCFNRDKKLARDVTYGALAAKVKQSPFFIDELGVKVGTSEMLYAEKNIRVIAVSVRSADALGRNVFGGVIDESDFMEGSILKGSGGLAAPGDKPFAELLYESIMRRMKSRYDRAGVLPGKLLLSSSARHRDSFTNRRIGEAANDPGVFCRSYAIYDVQPPERFSKKKFWVLVGNERIRHKILTKHEYRALGKEGRENLRKEGCQFIQVPENFRPDFERNIEDAIRDIAGIVTVTRSPFFQLRDRIYDSIDPTLRHPMPSETWKTDETPYIEWSKLVRRYPRRVGPGRLVEEIRPRRHPEEPRHVHIDLSLGIQDAAGICIAHSAGMIDVERRTPEGDPILDQAPLIEVDLMLRIEPPSGGEIDFASVRGLIYDFMKHGYIFNYASADKFQSHDTIQQLASQGIEGGIVSVDKTIEPYTVLKTAIYEGRVSLYEYPILVQELEQLQRDDSKGKNKGKVDHPPGGCFTGDTRVPLLDGTMPTMRELDGQEVWVYSSSSEGQIVPGRARGRMTKVATELVDVVLDSGAVVRCTPDHRWMLRDGNYKEAATLEPGVDRLMPINRFWPVNGGYESLSNRDGERKLTHHAVWEYFNGPIPEGSIVHHLNHDKTDNSPGNLEAISKADHSKEHASERYGEDSEWLRRFREGKAAFDRRGRDVSLELLAELRGVPGATNQHAVAKMAGCHYNIVGRVLRNGGFQSWDAFVMGKQETNHKVRAVIPVHLEDGVPVYDLEVDEHHNFALCAGVFVHNSKDVADALAGVVFTLTTQQSYRAPILMGISEFADQDKDSEWIRKTMERSGEEAPQKVGDVPPGGDKPIVFTG